MTSTPKNRPASDSGVATPAAASASSAAPSPASTAADLTQPPLFDMGDLYGTPGALRLLATAKVDGRTLLDRHCRGDWGDCCEEDAESNDQAVEAGGRLLSVYMLAAALPAGAEVWEGEVPRVWVITEGDRSTTTLLLPEEY